MSKVVILTEKPSAARNFSKALGGMSGKLSSGEDYQIVNAVGHIFGFADVHKQVPKSEEEFYKKWNWDNIPFAPDAFLWKLIQKPGTTDIMKNIKAAVADADELVCATDVDPSGEGGMIFAEIVQKIKYRGKMSRCYHIDESAAEIQKAVAGRKPIASLSTWDEYLKASCRQKFDFLSISWTRLTTLTAQDAGKRAVTRQGRLKSVMVSLVGQQLAKVRDYKKIPYYEAIYIDNNGHHYRRKPENADRKASRDEVDLTVYGPSRVVVDKTEQKRTAPGKLIDLAGLSGILSSRGYKPRAVLAAYQKMYEDQVVSYPRTEDKVITQEQFAEFLKNADKIADCVGVDKSLLTHRTPRKQHIGNGSHGANRPGPNVPASLDDVEKKYGKLGRAIYQILAKQTLSILGEDYIYEHSVGHIEDHPDFKGSANVPVSLGFKQIFDTNAETTDKKSSDEDPDKDGGEGLPLGDRAESSVKEGFPPKPSNPTVKWLVKQLEKYSVGTGATRTSTIAEITNDASKTQLMEETKGRLSLTYIGNVSYVLTEGTMMASVETTERLFNDMELIGAMKKKEEDVLSEVETIFEHDLPIIRANAENLEGAPNMEQYTPKEKVEGVFVPTGETVRFNVEWGGHRFTEDEQTALLNGDEISFEAVSKKGNNYTAKGSLKQGTFNGNKFWGFQLSPREPSIPDVFCQHEFTDDEKQKLLDGETIFVEDMISRKNKPFSANISFKDGKLDLSFD